MNTKQKKALYESIMKSVSKTVKRKLNENVNASGMCFVGYVEDSTDGMALFPSFHLFRTYDDAVKYVETECDYGSAYDYVGGQIWDGDTWETNVDLPDYYNEGSEVIGGFVLDSIDFE